jgi:hypothetical protein
MTDEIKALEEEIASIQVTLQEKKARLLQLKSEVSINVV